MSDVEERRYRHPMPWRSMLRVDPPCLVMGAGVTFVGLRYGLIAGGLWMLGMLAGCVFGYREARRG